MTTAVANSEDALLLENLDLVRIVRVRHFFWWRDADELEQIGRIALWEMIQKAKQVETFRAYAYSTIRYAMLGYICKETKHGRWMRAGSVVEQDDSLSLIDLIADDRTPITLVVDREETKERKRLTKKMAAAKDRLPKVRQVALSLFLDGTLNALDFSVSRAVNALHDEMLVKGSSAIQVRPKVTSLRERN